MMDFYHLSSAYQAMARPRSSQLNQLKLTTVVARHLGIVTDSSINRENHQSFVVTTGTAFEHTNKMLMSLTINQLLHTLETIYIPPCIYIYTYHSIPINVVNHGKPNKKWSIWGWCNLPPTGLSRVNIFQGSGWGKHFNPRHIQDQELRKRFDKNKTLKQNMEATNLKEMYKDRSDDVWWCLMMSDDAWWCLMMSDDVWWISGEIFLKLLFGEK